MKKEKVIDLIKKTLENDQSFLYSESAAEDLQIKIKNQYLSKIDFRINTLKKQLNIIDKNSSQFKFLKSETEAKIDELESLRSFFNQME